MSASNHPKSLLSLIGLIIYTEAFGPVKVLEVMWSEVAKDYVAVVDQQGTLFASFGKELVFNEEHECKEPSS